MVHEMAVAGSLISQLAAKMFMKSTDRAVKERFTTETRRAQSCTEKEKREKHNRKGRKEALVLLAVFASASQWDRV
jgi:hypothetical protein